MAGTIRPSPSRGQAVAASPATGVRSSEFGNRKSEIIHFNLPDSCAISEETSLTIAHFQLGSPALPRYSAGHERGGRNSHFRVAFYPDHRPVVYHPLNPTGRSTLLFDINMALHAHAHAYIPRDNRDFVLSAVAINDAGIRYEPDFACRIAQTSSPEVLGSAILEVLKRYRRKDKNLRNAKKSEWPAFLASGLKTAKSFEESYYFVDIESDERRVTLTRFSGSHSATDTEHLPPSPGPSEIGFALIRLHQRITKNIVEQGIAPNDQ